MLLWSIFVVVSVLLKVISGSKLPPHIVFVMADDLGWSDIGYHNISAVRTPNIDRLAKNGVKLRNYYVQPMCSPTRGALLTGKYPIHTGKVSGKSLEINIKKPINIIRGKTGEGPVGR